MYRLLFTVQGVGSLCHRGSLSRESLSGGVSVWRSLCPGESLSRGVSVQEGLCLGVSVWGSLSRGISVQRLPPLADRMTDVSETITFPQTSFAGGKNDKHQVMYVLFILHVQTKLRHQQLRLVNNRQNPIKSLYFKRNFSETMPVMH